MSYNPYSPQGPYSSYGGYQQYPPQHDPYRAGRAVAAPAICMTVVAAVWLVLSVFSLFGTVFDFITGDLQVIAHQTNPPGGTEVYIVARFAFPVAMIAAQAAIIAGGVKMKVLQGYSSANTAAILSVIPCLSPCVCFGIPFGIWALIVLSKPYVKGAFRS